MPQVQTIYDGNYIVWQRKLAEVVIDLKSDSNAVQQFGLTIAESQFFKFTVGIGLHLEIDIAVTASPNTWTNVYSGAVMAGAGWTQDGLNQVATADGSWQENTYTFDNGIALIGRYIRIRLAADSSLTPLQLVAIKKIAIMNHQSVSLTAAASSETNTLGWQTGEVLKEIMEDLLENRILLSSATTELQDARVSPKGTWDNINELYSAPAPRIFTTLASRLNDLELDAERRLTARKVVIPVEATVAVMTGSSEVDVGLVADAAHRQIKEYALPEDIVDIFVQTVEGVGDFEEPLRENGVMIYGKVTYGNNSTGFNAGDTAKVSFYRSSDDTPYLLTTDRTIRFVVPVETDLYHMDKYDLTRTTFASGVIQDIGVLNDIDNLQQEIRSALASDTVSQDLIVYEDGGLYYSDLAFDSNAAASSGWQVTKDGLPAIPGVDYTLIDSRKARLDTHDNGAPTAWGIQYFTNTKTTLDEKINELIEAIARITMSVLAITTNIDEINDALVVDTRVELLQYDKSANDGYDYFKPLNYVVANQDNDLAILYKNGVSLGAKDTVWAFRDDGVVAMFRTLSAYDRTAEYSIKYYFKKHDHLVDKLHEMTDNTDRNLIVENWKRTNPVPLSAESDGIKLI